MKSVRFFFIILLLTLLMSCAQLATRNRAFLEGQQLIAQGQLDAGLKKLEQAAYEEPDNREIRTVLTRQREAIANQILNEAENLRAAGNFDSAEQQYRHVQEITPNSERAKAGLEALYLDRHQQFFIEQAREALARNDVEGAEAAVRAVLQENPMNGDARLLIREINQRLSRAEEPGLALMTTFDKPITMEFRDASLKTIFELISRTAGINFIFDKSVQQESKTSIFVRDNRIEDVLKLLLVTNQLAYKILNDNSLLIYPDTPAKQKEYQELVVRSFHVVNTDVKQMVSMIRGLVKAKDIYVNEKLNLFVMRDTLEAIRLVERLVAINDFPDPEVMLDVEVLEVNRNNVAKLGPNFPGSITYTPNPGGTDASGNPIAAAATTTLDQMTFGLKNFSVSNQVVIDLRKDLTFNDLLANPRIRVKNREKAKILIGSRQPIITSNVTGTAATVSQSVTFIDVGLKLEVEPVISPNNEVAIKVMLEVSSITGFEAGTTAGSRFPVVGTRTAETLLSSNDGETHVLAGLINDDDKRSLGGIPGLIDTPILNRLFGNQSLNRQKTEIILLITPRIVRNVTQPTKLESEFYSGTANAAGRLQTSIRKTLPQSLALAPSGPALGARSVFGGAQPTPSTSMAESAPNPFAAAAAQQAGGASPSLTLLAPTTVPMDREFTATVRLVTQKTNLASELNLTYDKDLLEALDGGEKSGVRTIKLGREEPSGMTTVLRFKAISPNPGTAEIAVQSLTAQDDKGNPVEVSLPPPVSVEIQ
ncbi:MULTISPECIES: FecR domain-containing protein [Nitrosomonas]|uniref:General secretion pathway protein D n=2 Tax=Pseudomonadota TaxID=1224 RepID=A0A0F7KFT1_9PROT|nr:MULTISPECIES: FecR domain-containing protein [Nitrosomonas]AKH38008.1 general secretion pathway protein GspD [Nitrosomonas communis]TYP91619.1 general secretion pathway protein D [Nitrosomonas communis]UVS59895.1 general secretion pathway protein GspD [Nitrosomonas sp. PLL12]